MVRRVIESPVAGELLDLHSAMHARVRRDHVHLEPKRRFEEALVPVERDVARLRRIAARVEGTRENIFVVVEETTIPHRRRTLRKAGAFENERIVMLRNVSGPDVQRIDAESFRECVDRERGAARGRPDKPDVIASGRDAICFPLTLHCRRADFVRYAPDAERDEMNRDATFSRLFDDRWSLPADSLDVAGEKRSRLLDV